MTLIHIQFPIVDIRCFSGEHHLPRPNWYGSAIPDKDFIRGVGIVKRRPGGGLSDWIGEDPFCSARCVVRMDMDEQRKRGFLPFHSDIRFRRFYSDGLALAKFELGFETAHVFSNNDFLPYLQAIATLPIRVRARPKLSRLTRVISRFRSLFGTRRHIDFTRTPLIISGKALATFYAFTTTKHHAHVGIRSVDAGSPAIFIEANTNELPEDCLPARAKLVPGSIPDLSLYHWWHTFLGRDTHIWLCLNGRSSNRDIRIRNLRVYILRLHAEHEIFTHVLNAINSGQINVAPGTHETELLQEYLNRTTQRVLHVKAKVRQLSQNDDLTSLQAGSVATVLSAQRRAELLQKLQKVVTRKNIFRKIASDPIHSPPNSNGSVFEWTGIIEFIHGGLRWHIGKVGKMSAKTSSLAAFMFGIIYITALLAINLMIENPSPTQYQTFRIILALAAGGIGSTIPGILEIDMKAGSKFALHAAGALALFVIVYFFSPGIPPSTK